MNSRTHSAAALAFTVVVSLGLGCSSAQGWQPPPPAGTTYVYEYQGFKEKGTTAFGGAIGLGHGAGLLYGGAFSFREGRELQGEGWKDPFAESTPIDGIRFNEHLGPRGVPLGARIAAPAASSSSGVAK